MKSILRRICDETEPEAGTDITYLLGTTSKTTIRVYIHKGWLERNNGKLILTKKGYVEAV